MPAHSAAGRLVDLNSMYIATRLGGHRVEFLDWGHFPAVPWRNYPHAHSYFETCFAYSGAGVFHNRGHDHQVATGDIFVARPGETHYIISDDRRPLGIYFWAHTVLPDTDAMARLDEAGALLRAFANPAGALVSPHSHTVRALLDLLDHEAGRRAAAQLESATALASALVVATARAILSAQGAALAETHLSPSGIDAAAGPRAVAAARAMIRYLQDNYEREIAVRDVAVQVQMSERHASRVFRQATGSSIRGRLRTIRLDEAAARLAARESPIKEVARACGYLDVRHFTTAFRRHFGVAPAAFRQQRCTRFTAEGADR